MASVGVVLKFSVHKYSSYSSSYYPENILVNKPDDQGSRWSSDSNHPPQFLLLKLAKPAVVQSVTFGKYKKIHVCNVKKFVVYGGLSEENMIELLESGLNNDHIAETFPLRHTIDGNSFPCRYIRIVPVQSWGASFNFSIWYVELRGCDDPEIVQPCLNWYNMYREQEVIRLCLKHFRQHNYSEAFEALWRQTRVTLEHPALTDLHTQLVVRGDFVASEKLIESAVQEGWFNSFISQQEYKTQWIPMEPVTNATYSESRPGMRGGHQMSIDVHTESVYLFGGWDGTRDLADFWVYHTPSNTWTCLSKNTEEQGGPCARSCHKMCLDATNKQMFLLGRYLEPSLRTAENLRSDFYVYELETDKWTLITDDTAAMGGPCLLFDHHLAIDVEQQTLYVFGGRQITSSGVLSPSSSSAERASDSSPVLSGLYSYHIPTNTWTKLRDNQIEPQPKLGQSMVFHPTERCLYIFAGERNRDHLNDIWLFYVDTNEVKHIADVYCKDSLRVPSSGFTQRATLDPELNEIHVLTGLSRDKSSHVQNSLWVYDINKNRWSCVYSNENTRDSHWTHCTEPVPRYAHQFVYNHVTKVHYLFGGNPGKDSQPNMRLDDLWSLKLCRLSCGTLLQDCRYRLRRHRFEELAHSDPVAAVQYLQTDVFDAVDHSNPDRKREFEQLPSLLFKNRSQDDDECVDEAANAVFVERAHLYDSLVEFFPESMTQPRANLTDMVTLQ